MPAPPLTLVLTTTALFFSSGLLVHAHAAVMPVSAMRPAPGTSAPAAPLRIPANHFHPLTPAQLAAPVPHIPMPEHLPGDDSICIAAGDPLDLPIVSSLFAPGWKDLDDDTREALAPFAPEWNSWPMSEKRPWLAFAERMRTLPEPQRQRARRRILEWANMSPEERRIARINHQQARKRPMPERMREWEQYRALSWSEREALRHRKPTPPGSSRRWQMPRPPGGSTALSPGAMQSRDIIHRSWQAGARPAGRPADSPAGIGGSLRTGATPD